MDRQRGLNVHLPQSGDQSLSIKQCSKMGMNYKNSIIFWKLKGNELPKNSQRLNPPILIKMHHLL